MTPTAPSILRTVSGSTGSALSSRMPNVAAGNLASAGASEVRVFSGNCSALSSLRPASSAKSDGSSMRRSDFSGSTSENCTAVTPSSDGSPPTVPLLRLKKYMNLWKPDSLVSTSASEVSPRCCSNCGLCLPSGATSTIFSANLRGTGDENSTRSGRIGKQSAREFTRSQVKLAVNAGRTTYSRRRSSVLATPLAVAMPLAHTSDTFASGAAGRPHCKVTLRACCGTRPTALRMASRVAPPMTLTGTRSPTPANSQYAKRWMLSVVTGPLSSNAKACSSSIFEYSLGDG